LTLLLTHAPNEETDELAKEKFHSSLENVSDAVPNYVMKTVLRDLNAKAGKASYLYPAYGGHSLNNEANDNGK
jgi:hypothetical protein